MKANFTILISILFLNFSLAQNYFIEDSLSSSFNLALGLTDDFNGDGYDDFLGLPVGLDDAVLLLNETTNPISFSPQFIDDENPVGLPPAKGDFDNDGDIDFISTIYDPMLEIGVRHLYTNDGTGSFTSNEINITNTIPPFSALSGDFMVDLDGDGDMDIVGEESFQWDRIELYVNEGNNTDFTYNIVYEGGVNLSEYIRYGSLDVRDIDGDGDMDILFATFEYLNPANTQQEDKIKLLVNDGSNNFETLTISSSTHFVRDLEIVDINNDGLLDITAITDRESTPMLFSALSETIVWLQNPDLSFGQPEVILSNPTDFGSFFRMSFVDINNDDAKDLVILNNAGFIRYFTNNNALEPDFNAEPIFVGNLQPSFVPVSNTQSSEDYLITGDFNNDGKVDIAGMDTTTDPVTFTKYYAFRWYINSLDNPTNTHDSFSNEDDWSISPNPFHDLIRLENIVVDEDEVLITSITGQTILRTTLDSNVLDLVFLPEGVYVLSIINPDGKYSNPVKIIKLK